MSDGAEVASERRARVGARSLVRIAAACSALSALPLSARAEPLAPLFNLSMTPVKAAPGLALGADVPVLVRVSWVPATPKPNRVLMLHGVPTIDEGDVTSFVYRGYPRAKDAVEPAHTNPSFLVDFDVGHRFPEVKDLAVKRFGEKPKIEELEALANELIPKKNLSRALDAASVVLRRGEGDCTEHAVLLAALARMFGHPARVAEGLLVLEHEGKLYSAGHAWTEIHDGTSWRLADATRPGPKVVYVPLILMSEGTSPIDQVTQAARVMSFASIELAPAP